eukprot:6321926-Pyramimonas_sp.AAC.1
MIPVGPGTKKAQQEFWGPQGREVHIPSLGASVQVKRTVKVLGTMVNDRLDVSDEIAYRIASVA